MEAGHLPRHVKPGLFEIVLSAAIDKRDTSIGAGVLNAMTGKGTPWQLSTWELALRLKVCTEDFQSFYVWMLVKWVVLS